MFKRSETEKKIYFPRKFSLSLVIPNLDSQNARNLSDSRAISIDSKHATKFSPPTRKNETREKEITGIKEELEYVRRKNE